MYLIPLRNICIDVEFFLAAVSVHIADFPEDRTIEPRAIMDATDRPHDPGVTIGVTPIEFVAIVECDGDPYSLFWIFGPFEDFLGPVHTHITVNFSGTKQFILCSVPEGVMCTRLIELFKIVYIFSWIVPMLKQ